MSVKKNDCFEKVGEIPSPIATFLFYLSITLITSFFFMYMFMYFMYTRTHGRLQILCVF